MNDNREWLLAPQIERLVDGELSPEEYGALLASLEEQPGAWRQCALAFLESQVLRQELGQMRRSLDVPQNEPVRSGVAPKKNNVWEKVQVLLALAASFLIAFSLGLAAPGILRLGQEVAGGGNMNAGSPVAMTDGRDGEEVPHEVVR